MRGSLVRRGGIVLAALALPLLFVGPASAASSSDSSSSSTKLAPATLNGSGSTFQYGFNQVVIGGFKQAQKAVTINYQSVGSGQGRTDFANQVTDFGGTRRGVRHDGRRSRRCRSSTSRRWSRRSPSPTTCPA